MRWKCGMELQRNGLVLAGFLVIALVFIAPVQAAVVMIDNMTAGGIPGAITAAGTGGTVILQPGTYNQHDIAIPHDITIRANTSFGGTAADTIIDAQSSGRIFFNTGGQALTIDNLTLQHGRTMAGGAIYNNGGTVTITGSTITGCTASDNGGAIYNDGGTVTITGSTFSGCSATGNGGTIHASGSGTVTIDMSGFTGNPSDYSANNGGAIYADSVTVSIDSTTFSDFSATQGGTIFTNGGTCTITATTFSGGWAGDDGGAIYNTGPLTITSSTFSGSGANMEGGAIENTGSLTVASSVFEDCRANNNGGAINNGGTLTMSGSTITGCTASYNGGAIDNGGTLTMSGSTITGCTATNYGGAIHSSGHLTVTSSTFTGNAAAGGAGSAIYSYGSGSSIHFSRFYQNLYPVGGVVCSPTSVEAQDNWWGTSNNPNTHTMGYVSESPWLVLGITADPASIDTYGTSAIRTNLTYNKTAGSHPVGDTSGMGHVPDGITNTFAMVSGSGAVLPLTDGTANGIAQTTFTPLYGETVNISGTVDDQTVYIEIPVAQTAPVPTGITPNTGVNTSSVAITNLAGSSFTIIGTTNVVLMRTGYTNITATVVTVVDNTQITCTLPITGAEPGGWDVVVINPDGQEGVLANGFTITAPAPTPVPTAVPSTYRPDDGSGETLSDFPSSGFPLMTVTVNIGGDSKAWQAVVTGTKLSDLIVTGTVQSGSGSNVTALPGIVFQYISLVPARYNTITNAVINFTVPQSWLDENHIDPKSIVLYRQIANGWEALPTSVLYAKDGTVYYSAESAGFSLFAIAGTPAVATPALTTGTSFGSVVEEQATLQNVATEIPATKQTTAPPAATPQPAAPVPLLNIVLIIAAIGILAGSGFMVRRWWIRRQNPALFRQSD